MPDGDLHPPEVTGTEGGWRRHDTLPVFLQGSHTVLVNDLAHIMDIHLLDEEFPVLKLF